MHSSLIESSKGLRILTDPYDDRVNFPKEVSADIVTVSHGHFDHCYLQKLRESPLYLEKKEI